MAYRYGERHQSLLLPPSIGDYVRPEDPVRAYDAFVEALDLEGLGIPIEAHKRGCPEYFPRVMLKILVFGYAYGIRSSRKLERMREGPESSGHSCRLQRSDRGG